MNNMVKSCCDSWRDGHCRLSSSVEGWGCRLMVCIPDVMPRTKKDKGLLFHKVYTYAEKLGVLECPYFDEANIDKVIDSRKKLREMVDVSNLSQTDLLSEEFS